MNDDVDASGKLDTREVGHDGLTSIKIQLNDPTMNQLVAGNVVVINGQPHILTTAEIAAAELDVLVAVKSGMNAIVVEVTNSKGQVERDIKVVEVINSDLIGTVTVVEDLNSDNILNSSEKPTDNLVDLSVELGADIQVGDIIEVEGITHTVTQADLDQGFALIENVGPLKEGINNFEISLKDAAGQLIEEMIIPVVVDTKATDLIDQIRLVQDQNGDGVLNLKELGTNTTSTKVEVLLGQDAQAGDTITINGQTYTITQSEWLAGKVIKDVPINADANTITASMTDAQGNVDSEKLDFIVNTIATDLVGAIGLLDDLDPTDGAINQKELGNDNKVDISIALTNANQAGDIINVNGDNYVLQQADINAGQIEVSITVREGNNQVVVKATDQQGNVDSSALTFLVDTKTVNPVVTGITTIGGGTYGNDQAINADELANPVIIQGTAEPNATVVVSIAGLNTPFTVTANATGVWSVPLTTSDLTTLNSYQQQQADASLNIEITATDTVGNVSAIVQDDSIVLDTEAPEVTIQINAKGVVEIVTTEPLFKLDNGAVTPVDLQDIADQLTSDQGKFIVVTPTGSVQPYIQFVPMDPNSAIDPTTVDLAKVDFYGPVTVDLAIDTFTDEVGNGNLAGQSSAVTVDMSLPPTLTITSDRYVVDATDDTTIITFEFSELITGFDLSDVKVTGGTLSNLRQDVNNPEIYTAVFTPNQSNNVVGKISVDPNAFHSVTTGKSNDQTASLAAPGEITGDVVAPASVELSLLEDTFAVTSGAISEHQKQDGITNNPTIKVSGLEAELGWEYSTDGGLTWLEGAAKGSTATTGQFNLPAAGKYELGDILVRQYDGASANDANTTVSIFDKVVTLDTQAPTVSITEVADGDGIDQAERQFGYEVKGTSEANGIKEANVQITITVTGASGNPHTATVMTDAKGNWSYKVPANAVTYPSSENTISISAVAKDSAGNVSASVSRTEVVTDLDNGLLVAANATIGVVAGDNIINGAESAAAVKIYGDTNLGLTYARIFKVNADGTKGTQIFQLDGSGWKTGSLISSQITSQNTWSADLTAIQLATMTDGKYRIEVYNDNGSTRLASRDFTVKKSIAVPTFEVRDDSAQNILTDKAGYSNDPTPTWSGTTEPKAIVEIKVGNISYGTVVAGEDGSWSITAQQPLPEGTNNVIVQVTDSAGNQNSSSHQMIVDTVVPEITIDQPIAVDDILTAVELQQGLTVSGKTDAEDGQIVQVTVNGLGPVDAVVMNGEWTANVPSTLLDDITWSDDTQFSIEAVVTDRAGNISEVTTVDLHYKDNDLDQSGTIVEFDEKDLLLATNATTGLSYTGQFDLPNVAYSRIYLEPPATALTSKGQDVLWEHNTDGDLIGYVNNVENGQVVKSEVIVVSIKDDGTYTVNLKQAIGHGKVGTSLDDVLAFDIRMNFANHRGDVSESEYITVKVTDDQPTTNTTENYVLTNSYEVEGNVFIEKVSQPDGSVINTVHSIGADGGFVKTVKVSGVTFEFDPVANTITKTGSSPEIITYAYNYKGLEGGELLVTTLSGETITVNLATGQYHYSVFEVDPTIYNKAEPVSVSLGGQSDSLLGTVGLNVAGLIDLQNEQLFSVQGEGIYSVEVSIWAVDLGGLLGSLLGKSKELLFNDILKNELGLKVVSQKATLGLAEMKLTISNPDGTPLDALKVNQLLKTVTVDGGALGGILDLSVLPTVNITAKGASGNTLASKGNTELANVGLLGDLLSGAEASTVIMDSGSASSELQPLDNNQAYSLYGLGGNDTLYGGNKNDILYGGSGNDTIFGGAGNDLIVGGQGNDVLTGGDGSDVFRWEKKDYLNGFLGAVDRITDFDMRAVTLGGDVIDLSDMLVGAGRLGFGAGNLINYLHFEFDATTNQTLIYISVDGDFVGGFNADLHMDSVNQIIKLDNVNLLLQGEGDYATRFNSDYEVIGSLISNGKLIVPKLDVASSSSNNTNVEIVVEDNDGDTSQTDLNFDTSNLEDISFNPNNQAPLVFGKDTSLLGLVGLDVLGLIELGAQDVYIFDADQDLRTVSLKFEQLLGVNVTKPTFTYSTQLATELGIKAEISANAGVLGLIASSVTITLTSTNPLQPNISNAAINQLLATVRFTTEDGALGIVDGNLLSLDLLNNIKVTATDSQNISTTESLGKLLDLSLVTQDSSLNGRLKLIEGNVGNDSLDASTADRSVVMYGYGGDDVLTGSHYNDAIYGGVGNDTIHAGAGNDYVSGGAGSDIIYGGAGHDILFGNDGNDKLYGDLGNNIFNGGAGNDEFYSQAVGRDTVIYDLLNNADARGGHGSDTWFGFQKGATELNQNADIIDVQELLTKFDHSNYEHLAVGNGDLAGALNYLSQFIQVGKSGNNTVISIDRDGSGANYSAQVLLTLDNTDTTLEELVRNQQLLF
ncbi:Ig-like domain-containing protein [Acinetobacter sp. CFCC 10889]|uniref:Ig-like domain-containing protein n=1 Tax=Acinetobacter sp. CFCC 10889 TaxID=1775557 RepID=UPI001BC8730A|nr:Ig-like domain-containing protein [Acinetobacter sp. CFCC 10889]